MILASVLLVKMVNISSAERLRSDLASALSGDMTLDGIKGALNGVRTSVSTTVEQPSGNGAAALPESSASPAEERTGIPEPSEIPVQPNTRPQTDGAPPVDEDFRIDEDILNQINTREDTYNAPKKP